jgi:hypothetical protein
MVTEPPISGLLTVAFRSSVLASVLLSSVASMLKLLRLAATPIKRRF